jgi:DNA-binding winged helix-turn-helix (wHTH) protein/Tol biopolymer transport system component
LRTGADVISNFLQLSGEILTAAMNQQVKHFYAFGPFKLDTCERLLLRDGQPVSLPPKAVETLLFLVQNAGHLVEKNELMRRVWPDTFVEEGNLTKNIFVLRKILGEGNGGKEYIETIPKRGYRFIASVILQAHADVLSASPTESPPQSREQPSIEERAHSPGRAKRNHWPMWVTGSIVVSLCVGIVVRFASRQPPSPQAAPELKVRQLTTNSFENRVTSGAISPDGKYLAFADMQGMHIKLLEIGEAQNVSQPESLRSKNVVWEVNSLAWFPDSTRFVANAHPAGGDWTSSEGVSTWMVSVLGGAPRKLRDNALSWSVSPDGSLISFGTNKGRLGDREIWLMGPGGEHARKLYEARDETYIDGPSWSPDGQRFVYFIHDKSGGAFVSRDLKGGAPTTLFPPSEMKNFADALWLLDGRMVYSVRESRAIRDTCNYWSIRIDARTGERAGKPKRLTNWTGFCMNYLSGTADGKRLAFQAWDGRGTVNVADLEAGGKNVSGLRHFTLDESLNFLQDWTADSKTIVFTSNRAGQFGIYKQSLIETTPVVVFTGAMDFRETRVSPDGNWVIGIGWPKPGDPSDSEELLRVPFAGGSPELIFQTQADSTISCARPPHNLCAIAEVNENHEQMIVTAFDAIKGRDHELARFGLDPNEDHWLCAISPDGTRLAASRGPEGPIHILSFRGQPEQVIQGKNLNNMSALNWAADGKGLFVSSGLKDRTTVLHVDLQGNATAVWKNVGGAESKGMPSPDGRHLAIQTWTTSSNMWMIENF